MDTPITSSQAILDIVTGFEYLYEQTRLLKAECIQDIRVQKAYRQSRILRDQNQGESAKQLHRGRDSVESPHAARLHGKCPFTSSAEFDVVSSNEKRHDDMETRELEEAKQDVKESPAHVHRRKSSHESQSGTNTTKCPIRLLDDQSPEELAKYVESRKHEIPRSHEVCIKRYQRNEQSIRLLDSKYGNLVNMIQGLGIKHQSMLAPKKELESDSMPEDNHSPSRSTNMQDHSGQDDAIARGRDTSSNLDDEEDSVHRTRRKSTDTLVERQGRFQRPLRDIRVGESPSRPWGVHVPFGLNAAKDQDYDDDDNGAKRPDCADERNRDDMSAAARKQDNRRGEAAAGAHRVKANEKEERSAPITFTGPVFMGLSSDQVAEIMRKLNV